MTVECAKDDCVNDADKYEDEVGYLIPICPAHRGDFELLISIPRAAGMEYETLHRALREADQSVELLMGEARDKEHPGWLSAHYIRSLIDRRHDWLTERWRWAGAMELLAEDRGEWPR